MNKNMPAKGWSAWGGKNEKGFIGLLSILVVIVVAAIWLLYLYQNGWGGKGKMDLSGGLPGAQESQSTDINGQLDDLKKNVKNIQDAKDKEIYDAMGK